MPSVWAKILGDVKTLVTAVSPTGIVKVRKRIKRFADEEFPLIVISPLRDVEVQAEEAYGDIVHIDYEVLIAIIYDGNQKLETDLNNVLDAREAIRHALHVTGLTNATTVYDSLINLEPTYDATELDKNYDYSSLSVTYRSKESRNS